MQEYTSQPTNTTLLNKAAIELEKAIEIYPDFLNFHFNLAKIYEYSGRYPEAIIKYNDAIKIDSTFSYEPYLSVGIIYFYQNNFSAAAKYLEKAVVMNYYSIEIYNTLAQCFIQSGQEEKAINILKIAQSKTPGNMDAILNLGKLYYSMNRNQEALVEFIKAQNINGNILELNQLIEEIESSL
jgi:tetratricopeptide (TPR) repeat protein